MLCGLDTAAVIACTLTIVDAVTDEGTLPLRAGIAEGTSSCSRATTT